jgi:hypothetical protein
MRQRGCDDSNSETHALYPLEGDVALVPGARAWIAVGSDTQSNKMRGIAVIFITTYRVKQLSKDETKELMGVFADKGVVGNVTAHYLAADGSQGVLIAEEDDLEETYRNILNYSEWIEYDTKPYLTIEQAVPHIMDYIG